MGTTFRICIISDEKNHDVALPEGGPYSPLQAGKFSPRSLCYARGGAKIVIFRYRGDLTPNKALRIYWTFETGFRQKDLVFFSRYQIQKIGNLPKNLAN